MLPRTLLASASLVAGQQLSSWLDPILGSPTVELDYATFRGQSRFSGVDSFLGMPFAKAGRFENPRVVNADQDKLEGTQDATNYGLACPQSQLVASPLSDQNRELGSILAAVEQIAFAPIGNQNQGEDCLSINVQILAGINSTAGLPVLFWIHGGGFELGSSAALGLETTLIPGVIYQGAGIVQRSIEMGQPVIFVSANHRLNLFGTLTGEEINDAGIPNLLLKDQRVAMEWVQKYIGDFGGDANRVTIFGESAGSFSVATHMLLNDGDTEGLFQGAIMASGGVLKVQNGSHEQGTFDFVASESGCGSASDKIACLKDVDYNLLYNVLQRIPNFFSFMSTKTPWYPRADGTYLVDSPHRLLRQGKIADVPYIIGDMKDEGTLFSIIPQLNITTDADLRSFWKDLYFQSATDEQIQAFTDLYSEDPREGSPYDTGVFNQLGSQYKRLASTVGDITFETGRRDLLEHTYAQGKRRSWTYQIEQSIPVLGQIGSLASITGLPLLGSFHVSDVVLNDFGLLPASVSRNTRDIMSTYIAFVNSQDPNTHGLDDIPNWPTWTPEDKAMLRYRESGAEVIRDDYREEQMRFINDNADTYMF